MSARGDRRFDLVLFGATGFTGGLTATYLAEHLPPDARWAIAGRSRDKLDAVRAALSGPAAERAEVVVADATDPVALAELAAATQVVITTVGPYLEHGEPLVAACAQAGTDYVDLTGEPEFVDRMYLAHHETAVASGARIVHACGFDSVPHDLGALFTVQRLPDDVPLEVRGVVRSNAAFSGGTFASALGQFARSRQMRDAASKRRDVEPRPDTRRSRAHGGAPGRDADLDLWLLPLPTVDPIIIKRSGAARADYGPDFSYSHFAGLKKLTTMLTAPVGVAGLFVAAQIPPVRSRLLARMPQGEGPSEKRRSTSWFTVDFIGEGGTTKVHTRVSGGDPGYDETAKMLAESAMCLAFDDNPSTAGQVTTATAMGENLTARLVAAGISFEEISD